MDFYYMSASGTVYLFCHAAYKVGVPLVSLDILRVVCISVTDI